MLKGKWFLALLILILAAACGDKPTSTAPVADTPENRKAAAKRYLEAVPPQELLTNVTGNMARRLSEPARKVFLEGMADKELLKEIHRISETALVKHFTPDELDAMTAFFGSPAGKSARGKFTPYMRDIMPQINNEIKKVLAKVQEKTKPAPPKEGAAKPEKPQAAPAKPEQAKPGIPQPEPEKPKAEHPHKEHPQPEKPKAAQPQPEKPKPEQPKAK